MQRTVPMIRRMAADDLPQVLKIEVENFAIPWSEQSFREMLASSQAVFLVAEAASEGSSPEAMHCLGYAGAVFAGEQADVTNIAVRGENKQQGIGVILLQTLLEELQTREVREVFLEVRESNTPARALYQKAGFAPVGRRKQYYTDPDEDAILMKKAVDGA